MQKTDRLTQDEQKENYYIHLTRLEGGALTQTVVKLLSCDHKVMAKS
jgi:hypothetical protein